ncbi:hypothetical protein ACFSCX_23800 [Bacillus salitolerans]|uniref:Uncharacterized protein n=1 Tax=Bacillus salitolerans TaxID=1437434 RepID=A0ABW4LZF7_9BACI
MSNRKMNLSGTGKEILDHLCELLEIDRPFGVKIALSKGLSNTTNICPDEFKDNKPKWTIPDNIIRDKEYLLFKHLIIEEIRAPLNEETINQQMLHFIELGLRIISNEIESLTSLEDYRIKILG